MQFGLHYLMSCPDSQSPEQVYRETIEQALLAEALGFESVWPVEHHFVSGASVMPSPMLLLAAIAARTQRLRLGTAIVQLPLNHPLRVAEDMATLDVISGGRVELGVGRGGNAIHYRGFGVDQTDSRERFEEGMTVLRGVCQNPCFTFHGKYYHVEEASLAPRPVQRPHPRLRVAANSPQTASWAGREGLPVMFATNVNPLPLIPKLMGAYQAGRAQAGHAPSTPEDVSLLMPTFVHDDPEQARTLMQPSIEYFVRLAISVTQAGLERCTTAEERQPLELLLERVRTLTYEVVESKMGLMGTPERCVHKLQSLRRELGMGRVITWFNFGGLVPHPAAMRSMALFSSQVMPHFQRED